MTTVCMIGGSDVARGRVWRSGMKTLAGADGKIIVTVFA